MATTYIMSWSYVNIQTKFKKSPTLLMVSCHDSWRYSTVIVNTLLDDMACIGPVIGFILGGFNLLHLFSCCGVDKAAHHKRHRGHIVKKDFLLLVSKGIYTVNIP